MFLDCIKLKYYSISEFHVLIYIQKQASSNDVKNSFSEKL